MCFFCNRWMKRKEINDYGNHKRRSNNKTFSRIELKKKRKSAQFLRPGISVKKFTRAVFRLQTHFLYSPKHLLKSQQATCFSMRQKVPISTWQNLSITWHSSIFARFNAIAKLQTICEKRNYRTFPCFFKNKFTLLFINIWRVFHIFLEKYTRKSENLTKRGEGVEVSEKRGREHLWFGRLQSIFDI